MAKKKEVSTTIDYDLYLKIKEKNYKISELIRLGYEYLENGKVKNVEDVLKKLDEILQKNAKYSNMYFYEKLKEIYDYILEIETEILSRSIINKYDLKRAFSLIKSKIEDIMEKLK